MNKINFILYELLNTLQADEGIIKCHPSVNNVENASLYKPFPKGKGKWKKKKALSNPNKILNPFRDIGKGKKVNDPKPNDKCFHCGITGHSKRNYPNDLTQKNNSGINESLIIGISFIAGTSNS